eukprot:scaffold5480_cov93-Skeletonema_dohrnii-CCMP3373.AAC.1
MAAAIPSGYRLCASTDEAHDHPIYCVAYSPAVHQNDDDGSNKSALQCFSTCAGQYIHIYEIQTADNKVLDVGKLHGMEGNHVVDGRDLGETRRNNFGDASSTTDTALEHVGVLDVGKLSENGGTICDA